MKHFIRNHGLIENLCAHGKIKFPRRHFVNIFSTIIFLFAFSLSHSQQNFLPAFSSSSNFTATNFHHQKNISNHPYYFGESNASEKRLPLSRPRQRAATGMIPIHGWAIPYPLKMTMW